MGVWKRERNVMKYYDSKGNLIKSYDTFIGNAWQKSSHSVDTDGYKTNNLLRSGQTKHVENAIQKFLETGVMPTADEIGVGGGNPYDNVIQDVRTWLKRNEIDEVKYSLNQSDFIYSDKGGTLNKDYVTPDKVEELKLDATPSEETPLNPYVNYMEQQRLQQENAERGLLNATTDAAKQNADISAQQAMMQQSAFKDSLVEQIKSDRLSKMRSGISPMQIAQENLQYAVGNMQSNQQQMQLANQGQLAAVQQEQMNPYQAYINSQAATTGGQGYGAVATGMAASDAGDIYQQMLRMQKENPNMTLSQVMALIKQ